MHWCAMIQAHPSGLLCLVKKPLHAQKFWEEEWEMPHRESIHSFVASPLRRMSLSGLRRIFPSLSAGPLQRGAGYRWTPPWVNIVQARNQNVLNSPVVAQAGWASHAMRLRAQRERTPPCIDRPLRVKEKHSKQERRNKSNKFITTWPKRSEHDKRHPVVRRRAVEYPPPPKNQTRPVGLRQP